MPILTIEGPPITDLDTRRTLVAEVTSAYRMPKEKIIVLIRENTPEQVAVAGELICDRRS